METINDAHARYAEENHDLAVLVADDELCLNDQNNDHPTNGLAPVCP